MNKHGQTISIDLNTKHLQLLQSFAILTLLQRCLALSPKSPPSQYSRAKQILPESCHSHGHTQFRHQERALNRSSMYGKLIYIDMRYAIQHYTPEYLCTCMNILHHVYTNIYIYTLIIVAKCINMEVKSYVSLALVLKYLQGILRYPMGKCTVGRQICHAQVGWLPIDIEDTSAPNCYPCCKEKFMVQNSSAIPESLSSNLAALQHDISKTGVICEKNTCQPNGLNG